MQIITSSGIVRLRQYRTVNNFCQRKPVGRGKSRTLPILPLNIHWGLDSDGSSAVYSVETGERKPILGMEPGEQSTRWTGTVRASMPIARSCQPILIKSNSSQAAGNFGR